MAAKLLTVQEAAERKGITRSAIYQAIQSGKLPHTVVLGKIGLKEKDIDAYEPLPKERKGISVSGRPRIKPVEDSPKRGRGRPKKQETTVQTISAENGAQGQEMASTQEG